MFVGSLKYLKAFTLCLIAIESFALAYFMRPIQDDYFNLYSVQQMGVIGYLEDTWNFHGGNMVQFLIHCLMILPTTQSFAFWNFSLFFIVTEIIVFFSVRAINSWLFESKSQLIRFWVPLLSVAGFEGLFVPGFLGAFGFSLASLAHLWPVMAFVFALLSLKQFKGSWVLALLLGIIAGNSNLGESAFSCGVWVLLFLAYRLLPGFQERSGIRKNLNFYFLGFGSFVGTFGIVAAPGLWNRANDQVGLPQSFSDFVQRFVKSFASFTADGITHPMVWVLFFLGMLFSGSKFGLVSTGLLLRLRILVGGTLVIWFSLIMGSTFAYPAWHQSMGMYVLLLPLSFALGTVVRTRMSRNLIGALCIIASLIMTVTFIRIGVLGIDRSLSWDANLEINSCRIIENPNAQLLGAEIQYPPFGLGVDDVNTWEWMNDKYVGWVKNIPEEKCL